VTAAIVGWRGVQAPVADLAAKHSRPSTADGSLGVGREKKMSPRLTPNPNGTSKPQYSGLLTVRDPNLYERVVLTRARTKRATTNRPTIDATVEELFGVLAADPSADVSERLPTGDRDLERCERLLWGIIKRADDDRRQTAVRLLARLATPCSMSLLIGLASDPKTHEAAVLGLARLCGTGELARLASLEPDAKLRGALLETLLERRTPEAVGLYLQFVADEDTRALALTVVTDMANPPADTLLVFIESPQKSMRLAAAQALAELSGSDVAARLGDLVCDGVGRQEALIALLLSHSSQASKFLNDARRDLYLVASVHAAEQQLQSLGNSSGGNLP
jgi:hypothetical protein